MATLTVQHTPGHPVDIHYNDCGQGRPVVLIHGWPLSGRMWEAQVNALTEAGFRCITYDRRGFGESEKPWTGYDYDTMTKDLHALMEYLELRDATLVGFSMGGGEVARYFGLYGSDRVAQAVLVSSVAPYMLKAPDNPQGVDQEVFDGMMEQVKGDRVGFLKGFGKNFVNWEQLDGPISEALLAYHHTIASFASPKATQDCITAFAATDFRGDVTKIDVPLLIVHGDDDQIVPIEASSERVHRLVPASRYAIIEHAPHGLFCTHAEQLNALLLEFLRQA